MASALCTTRGSAHAVIIARLDTVAVGVGTQVGLRWAFLMFLMSKRGKKVLLGTKAMMDFRLLVDGKTPLPDGK